MKTKLFSLVVTTVMVFAITVFTACDNATVYHHFENTPETGWEKTDTLSFVVSPMAEPGRYSQQLDLRVNEAYPFTSLSLSVVQQVFPGNRRKKLTLHCRLTESDALVRRRGISYYKYSFAMPDIDLRRGDSIRVYIRHDMKRDILPGISNVGLKIVRKN